MSDKGASNRPYAGEIIEGKYELVKLLGEGGFGVVFEAKHRLLQDKVALKFYLPKWDHGPMERERFIREARAARRIKSEYSVAVADMGSYVKPESQDARLYIVMEYLDGENLYDHACRQPPLLIATAIDYILQASVALAKAHAMKITHRDLKPSNLFLTNHDGLPRVKVLDFGLAKDAAPSAASGTPETQTGQIIGTLAYMPPEQLRGLKYATHLTDIFALAVCLYFLLTLEEPFSGDEPADIIANVMTRPPTPLRSFRPDVPQTLVDVIERALAKDPAQRQQSVFEFARALVPYGSADAPRLLTMIESAAKAGAIALEKMEDEKPTIKLGPAPPPDDPTTIPLHRKAATTPLGMPQDPTTMQAPSIPVPRQTNSRFVLATIGALVVLTGFGGCLVKQTFFSPTEAPTPSASSAPSAAPSNTTPPIAPLPSATASQSSAPSPSAPPPQAPSPRVTGGPGNKTKPDATQKDPNKKF